MREPHHEILGKYWRAELAQEGRAPRVHAEQGFQWHDTPYVRPLSIADFEEFCRQSGFAIGQCVALDTEADALVQKDPNLNADVAVMVLTCADGASGK